MHVKLLIPVVFALAFAMGEVSPTFSAPINAEAIGAAAPAANIELARNGRGGGHRGGMRHGGGRHGGMHRGYARHGGAYRHGGRYGRHYGRHYGGRYGHYGRYGHGRYRYGHRYYGGRWYGTGRRYWRGRWWPYGVGACWRLTPIGYVWICS